MISELSKRVKKYKLELEENQKNPEKIGIKKGQNIQNLENTKKQDEELEKEIEIVETKFNSLNEESKIVQEKFTTLRENKARFEATLEGIDQRKMDLIYMVKNELKIENVNNLLSLSDLANIEKKPTVNEQENKLNNMKKNRESLGSVNLRADVETEKFKATIKKMEEDRADLSFCNSKIKN